MLAWKGDLDTPDVATYTQGPTIISAANGGEAFCWVATARTIEVDSGAGEANINDDATRTATRCFMRGLKERIEIVTGSDDSWRWRRVVFTYKGQDLIREDAFPAATIDPWLETSNGYVRLVPRITNTGTAQTNLFKVRLHEHLFKGVLNKDWDNVMNAKLTTEHVNVLYDKIITIKSGNGKGVFRTVKRWHPFNRELIYNDFEAGGDKGAAPLSSMSKDSMGDVYVVDFFEPATPGDQELKFWPQASLYWHER